LKIQFKKKIKKSDLNKKIDVIFSNPVELEVLMRLLGELEYGI